ncbi:energy transducer TonB [Pseudoxanthomonas sp. CF125]|uniref:energy transducer TonB n=1 Tax=Pseudoxanthomonas sp. CF125 TaxID=1855303 RepID=UPI000881D1C0|nr:energy transducer TonB [Pseudoxanthomonas sp. CF125]SDR13474.1 outer membrane transport energization protein TonB [Pseudoxanthomonas sp. CF125]
MSVATISKRSRWVALSLMVALAACSKDEQAGTEATTAAPAAAPAAAPPAPAVSAQVQAMSAEQLREAATKALSENRIYAPGGDNAMEYYLALRDKLPSDPAVTSALTDLMPYTLIATEQSIGREDFLEAQRLSALLEKADPKAPALPRLKQTIANAQLAVAARAETEKTKEVTAAETKALEEQRLAQQAEQQRAAAAALATQQQQDAARAAEAERVAAAQREAAQREAAARTTTPASTATAAPAAARPAASTSLKVVSSPSPRYPPEALRAGTAGEVLVEITIGTDGSVTNARVVRATPPRVFDREALNAVRRWKFEPIDAPTTTRRTLAFNPG